MVGANSVSIHALAFAQVGMVGNQHNTVWLNKGRTTILAYMLHVGRLNHYRCVVYVMMYLWPQASSMIDMPPQFGVITSPAHGTVPLGIQEGRPFAVDNESFTRGFEPARFFAYLELLHPYRSQWLFSVCPDVVGDAKLTIGLYGAFAHKIKPYSSIAFVAQDGQEALEFPLAFDWLFIGGTTEWKMSDAADECVRRAKALGKSVHVGRINSISRFRHFQLMEVDSCDGTFPIYEPDTAKKRLAKAVGQRALFSLH